GSQAGDEAGAGADDEVTLGGDHRLGDGAHVVGVKAGDDAGLAVDAVDDGHGRCLPGGGRPEAGHAVQQPFGAVAVGDDQVVDAAAPRHGRGQVVGHARGDLGGGAVHRDVGGGEHRGGVGGGPDLHGAGPPGQVSSRVDP